MTIKSAWKQQLIKSISRYCSILTIIKISVSSLMTRRRPQTLLFRQHLSRKLRYWVRSKWSHR